MGNGGRKVVGGCGGFVLGVVLCGGSGKERMREKESKNMVHSQDSGGIK